MIIEALIIVAIIIVFAIFARRLPEIKERLKINIPIVNKDYYKQVVSKEKKPSSGIQLFRNSQEKDLEEADNCLKNKDFAKAEELYLKIVSADPRNSKIYNRLGALYLEQNDFIDAKDAFREALKFDESIGSRWYNLALAQIGLKEYRSAINSLMQAVKLEKNNKKYLETLKDIRQRLKKITPLVKSDTISKIRNNK